MSGFIDISLFTGYHYLAKNSISNEELEQFISDSELEYLEDLLGDKYDAFIADCVADGSGLLVPQTEPYVSWYNPFHEKQECDRCYTKSKGIKRMLTGFVYSEFVNSQNFVHTPTGFVINNNENSEILGQQQVQMISDSRFNDAVRTYNAIKKKINGSDCSVCYKEIKTVFV